MKKIFFVFLLLISAEIYSQCPDGQYYDPVSGYCFDDADSYTEFLGHGIRLRKYAIGDNPGLGYNWNIDDIADIFLHREFEYQVNQIRVTNGSILVASGAKLDIGSDSISTSWAAAKLVFEDVTGRGLVPFEVDDILYSRTITKSGAGYDANGNIIDSDKLIRQFVYVVDSVNGLDVWVSPHVDALVPDNKGAPVPGDTFVKIGNESTGANIIEISSDLKYAPRITMIVDVRSWSDFLDEDHKSVVIGNLNGLTDTYSNPINTDQYGILINGGVTGGKAIFKNIELSISGGGARDEIDSLFATEALLGNMAFEDLVELAKLGNTIIEGGYLKNDLINTAALIVAASNVTGLGDLALLDNVTLAKLDTTIIIGGYVKTSLLDVDNIFTQNITATGSLKYESMSNSVTMGNLGFDWWLNSVGTTSLKAYQTDAGGAGLTTDYIQATGYFTGVYRGSNELPGNAGEVLRSDGVNGFIPGALYFSDLAGSLNFSEVTGTASTSQIPSLPASKITSGTFDIGLIPTGTTSSAVALGNHNHSGVYNVNLGIGSLGPEFYLFGSQLELVNSDDWNTAFSWGDHGAEGYLVSPGNSQGFLRNDGTGILSWTALTGVMIDDALANDGSYLSGTIPSIVQNIYVSNGLITGWD